MNFLEVAKVFQEIEKEPSRILMTKLFADLLKKSSARESLILAYLSSGSLFPPYKTLQFNLAKSGIIEIIAQLCEKNESIIQKKFKDSGDLGLVIYDHWQGGNENLSLIIIYETLIHCAEISGTGSTEKKIQVMVKLLRQVDSLSAKFIVRIVTGTLRLGFSDMSFLDSLSWMEKGDKSLSKKLEHAYNICADLGLVAFTLKSHGLQAIEKMKIHVGIPIRPSAAERLESAQAIIEKLGHCVAQPKLDGFRIQVHLHKSESSVDVHFFSRNLLDMSAMFPDLKKSIEKLPVENLIAEGEAIVFDQETETFLPFQKTVKRKRKHDVEKMSEEMPLRLYLFDLLYLNGKSLLDSSHLERREKLEQILIKTKDQNLQIIDQKSISTVQELENYFLQNISAGLEGLVIKREDAKYQPGKRNFNWIKLKREGGKSTLIDTIDCVILGYYTGKGKRAHFGIGAFLVGIYDAKNEQFQTIAKIGTGIKDDEWKDLKKQCDQLIVHAQPKNVQISKELIPDVWVFPEIICTIQADEITLSPLHTAGKTEKNAGFALRFPRFVSYRFDKSKYDTTSLEELKKLFKFQKQ